MIRNFVSRNPFTGKVLTQFDFISQNDLSKKLAQMKEGHQALVSSGPNQIAGKLENLSAFLENNRKKYASLISTEMGKPMKEALAEVDKSCAHCSYFAKNHDKLLRPEIVKTDAKTSYVSFQPLGGVYVMVPFNFPTWLTFKPVIPYILAGNSVLVRNSDSTPLMGAALEEAFQIAGFDSFEFQNVYSSPEQLETIISHPSVSGVSFCGSSNAGSAIAMMAGKYLKKSVLELGGLDPFIVLPDADVEEAVALALKSRLTNAGQVCFSAKRFIIHEAIYDEFKDGLAAALAEVKYGDPTSLEVNLGPIARVDLFEKLNNIIEESIKQGGIVAYQKEINRHKTSTFFGPMVIEIKRSNILNKEECFGPVFPLLKVKSAEEALEIANDSVYGLGGNIITKDVKKAEEMAKQLQVGMAFINDVVKSDSRLPSGGIKNSGYGRECGKYGLREFTNIKTTYIAPQSMKK